MSCCIVLLAACAEAPPRPAPPPAAPRASRVDAAIASAVAAHRQQAERYASSGDLAGAAREWQVVTLLAPDDAR
ncbi:MAG: hypothetical protein ABI569_03510, partial [Casimicrobiaceae bacterium]